MKNTLSNIYIVISDWYYYYVIIVNMLIIIVIIINITIIIIISTKEKSSSHAIFWRDHNGNKLHSFFVLYMPSQLKVFIVKRL